MCLVYVNEIATVEHFAPGRKKCSVYAHILLAAYMNGAIPTRALPRDAHLLALAKLLYVN